MPMAIAPDGIIIKLVDAVSDGTNTNSMLMINSGAAAIFILPRKYLYAIACGDDVFKRGLERRALEHRLQRHEQQHAEREHHYRHER